MNYNNMNKQYQGPPRHMNNNYNNNNNNTLINIKQITVGGHSVSTPDSWTLTNRDVSKIIIHPNYDKTTFKNDLALFKLAVSTF